MNILSKLKKIKAKQPRLKLFLYGPAKIGKTTAAISFPKSVWIDTEGCADKPMYEKLLESTGGAAYQTLDFDEVVSLIKELLTTKHDYKTVVIDSFTNIYNDLLDKSEAKVGSEFGRHYNFANKKVKHLINMLLRLDMNVIITAHSKNEYAQNLAVIGQTFDCYKKLDYLFDLILEVQKRGKERYGIVKGSRFEAFKEDDSFIFSYDEIANRYGREVMEKEAEPIEAASFAQVTELMNLIQNVKVPEETIEKWLAKANAERFEDMSSIDIQKCIEFLKTKAREIAA